MEGLDCPEGFLGFLVDPSGEGGGGKLGVEVAQGRQKSLGQEYMRVALSRETDKSAGNQAMGASAGVRRGRALS